MKYLKKLKINDIIIFGIFIILSILAILVLKFYSIILIAGMLVLVISYYNVEKITIFIKKKKRNIRKKKKNNNDLENIGESKEVDSVKKVMGKTTKKRKVKKEKKIKKEKRKWWKKVLTIILIFGIAMVLLVTSFLIYIAISAGAFDPNALKSQDQTVVYDKSGEIIATLGTEKRESVSYDELPQVLVDAILATEDSRFFQHNGVDLARFLKASVGQLLGHDDAGGASTLTMQVSKNNLTNTNSSGIKGIIRKFQDVYIAVFQIERKYTKKEIIEFYVNDNLLGSNVYGVGQASKYYFGKSVSELTLPEASLLAGMFQAPNKFNPYKNPEAAAGRRRIVLSLMVKHGYISQEEADMANAVDVSSMLVGASENDTIYQGYIDTVVEEVQNLTGNNPYVVAMRIYTNMDKDMQQGINGVLSGENYKGWADSVVQAGIAVTDVNTGAIVAVGTGRKTDENILTFNRATNAKRQPGSTAKPLFDYGPGFEYNNFSTYTLFNDEPWSYTDGPQIGNWDGSYYGLITLRQALSVSRNIPALKAFQQVDKSNIYKFIKGLGLNPNLEDGILHEAYSIGGGDGFSPLEMAVAYACFANGGYYIEPHAVNKIEYRDTEEIVEFNYDKKQVMKPSTAALMNNVLQYAVEYGFNGGARVYGSTVAAKTGTSNLDSDTIEKNNLPAGAVNDLWTVAYTPEYSIALWYGYDKLSHEHYLSGASAPKDELMQAIMRYIPKTTKKFPSSNDVVASQVEFGTWPAQLPSEYTPSDLIRTEYFLKGTEPTEVSERFAKLEDVSNVKTKDTSSGTKITWNFTTPKILTKDYLNTYFSQSVFGNGTSGFVNSRLEYNSSTLGNIGFGIYTKSSSGILKRIAFTTDKEYTYKSNTSSKVTLVIKVEYEKFKSNASNGVEVKFNANKVDNNTDGLKATLSNETITVENGNYVEEGVVVTYDGEDISNEASITYSVQSTTTTSVSQLEKKINSLSPGTYHIRYSINYLDMSTVVTRTIIVK